MSFMDPSYTPFQWQDSPSTGTPLDEADLMAAETSLVSGFQAGDDAVVAWVISAQALGNLGATKTLTLTTRSTQATGTLNANCALTIAGLTTKCSGVLLFTQDATGSRTLTVNGGSALTIPTTALAPVIVQFWSPDGTNIWVLS